MFGESQRPQNVGHEDLPVVDERPHEPAIGCAIRAQGFGCFLNRTLKDDRRAIVQRVSQRSRRMDPFHAVCGEIQGAKEGRGKTDRVYRGADVVQEPGQRQL
jgi:hypothetical protein